MEFKTKKELNSGLYSNAYLLDNEYIQLVGKRTESYDTYKEVKENSDLLKGKITCVNIPCDMMLTEPNNEYPFGCLVYKMVKGKPLNPDSLTMQEKENLAKKIMEFNNEMHNLDIHWDREWAINHELEKIEKNIQILIEYLNETEINQLKEYKQLFSNYLNSKKNFCITHGDLWADNLIVNDNNELTGVIDFGNMAYFLPEVDYASMWDMIDGFIEMLLKETKEDVTKESILLFVMHRELCSFEYVLDSDLGEITCQLGKIKDALLLILPQLNK